MPRRTIASQLEGAELWERTSTGSARAVEDGRPVMVAGWEDADSFCAAVCANDAGLAYCRRCPETVVLDVLRSGRARRARCGAGVDLVAFPSPRGSRRQVAVVRAGPPTPAAAARVAAKVRIPASSLRRAARDAEMEHAAATRAAARRLRTTDGLTQWRLENRQHAADRRRTTTAALAQMIVTSEEYLRLYQASRRHLAEIERQRRRLDDLAREKTTSAASERARIAHRIHDTAAQSMVSAFRYLEAVRATAPSEPPALRGRLDDASERLSTAIREVRAVLNDLIPPGLDELGLGAALTTRVASLAAEAGVEASVSGALPRLEPIAEQALYGMTLEAVTNAVRHARAGRIGVDLRTARGRAVVEVVDNGIGFDPVAAARARRADGGLGLLGIARQATWLGGSTSFRSRPSAGTRIRISIPIERSLRSRAGVPGGIVAPQRDPTPEVPV